MKVLEFFNKGNGGYLDDPLYYFNFKQNAYNKAINNYTVDHFVEKYLEPI